MEEVCNKHLWNILKPSAIHHAVVCLLCNEITVMNIICTQQGQKFIGKSINNVNFCHGQS